MQDLVSIIIPVYNSKPHLKECIYSVLEQSYKEFEILLIDDGSTDGSGEVCDELARKHNKIRVFHNANKGVSFSRNYGIEKSAGEYLLFIDSDDYIDSEFVKKLISPFPQADISVCRFYVDYGDSQKKYIETNLEKLVRNPLDLSLLFVDEKYLNSSSIMTDCVFGSVCRCAFKKDAIIKNAICFNDNIVLGEDLLFLCRYLINVNKAILIDEYLYFYRKNQNSAVSKNATGYVRDFDIINYPLLKEKIAIINKINNNLALIDYLNMKFTIAFAVNELKLRDKKSSKKLKYFFKEHKEVTFKMCRIKTIYKFTFKRKILMFFLKCRLWNFIGIFLR